MLDQNRRRFIKGSGAAIAGAVGLGAVQSAAAENGWEVVESPVSKTLNGTVLAANGPWAAGGGGKVLERTVDGWTVRLKNGPAAEGNGLTCMGVTDDGNRVWFAGGSGVIGEMDVVTKTLWDHSAPGGKTSTWEAISVTGTEEKNETISLMNGSGEELTGYRQPDGSIAWGDVVKPGGGASMKGAAHYGANSFVCCDTNAKVYESTDDGNTWETIGVDGGEVGFYGAAAVASDDMNVCGGGGIMYRYDGNIWTARKIGSNTIKSVDRVSEAGLACGGSGNVFRRQTIGSWEKVDTPTGANLEGTILGGELYPDVAVGASGTIVEKQP
ncbi:MAG: twin-arginine translocation signal domain-containing protein [Halolamina sp.]